MSRDLTFNDVSRVDAQGDACADFVMDEDTFRAFYDRTARGLWAYLSRVTGDRQMADDLLQEALTRVLTGRRVKPGDVSMVAFLGGIMRSLRADHIRRARRGMKRDDPHWLGNEPDERPELEVLDPAADPERALIATDELDKIRQLFADDPLALQIIDGLAEGLTAEQIRAHHGISRTDYDSARKRMRRCLIREGLTCGKV